MPSSHYRWDQLWINANLATMVPGGTPYGAIGQAALAVVGERIAWAGPMTDLPGVPCDLAKRVVDAAGAWLTPGLIDCHTHLVYGGNRAGEFERRLQGATYEQLAREGGGIRSTVAATRAADEASLLASAKPRLEALMAEGVTTVEIKSGYGLNVADEAKQLRVARRLGRDYPISVTATFLGAHAVPPEFEGRQEAYVDLVCHEALPAARAEGLLDAVDAFCETIAFSPAQVERIFRAASSLGLPVKLHAEQLSDQGGAMLAAKHGALSCDHLEYVSEDGLAAMARSGTVAVLLPGAFYTLRERRVPPVEAMRLAGVPIAVATDCNPGSSPLVSLLLALNMACTLFRLTPEEALAGATRDAARALGMHSDIGTLEAGKRADLAIWDIGQPAELVYCMGLNPLKERVWRGRSARSLSSSVQSMT